MRIRSLTSLSWLRIWHCCNLCQVADVAQMQSCHGCGVGWQLQLNSISSLVTSICRRCSLKEKNIYFFLLFRATPVAYRSSQARGGIELLACAKAVSNTSSELHLHHSSQQLQILYPVSRASDWTHILTILVWFITADPQREFLIALLIIMLNYSWFFSCRI